MLEGHDGRLGSLILVWDVISLVRVESIASCEAFHCLDRVGHEGELGLAVITDLYVVKCKNFFAVVDGDVYQETPNGRLWVTNKGDLDSCI